MNYLVITISVVCGIISLVLVLALVFSGPFRRDVLDGNGEATFAGILTAKGAIIIVLCAMFVIGMIYPIMTSNTDCSNALGEIRAYVESKQTVNAHSPNVRVLQDTIKRMRESLAQADRTCR